MVALDIKDDKRKRALLLHYMGESTLDIFETLAVLEQPTTTRKPVMP